MAEKNKIFIHRQSPQITRGFCMNNPFFYVVLLTSDVDGAESKQTLRVKDQVDIQHNGEEEEAGGQTCTGHSALLPPWAGFPFLNWQG